MIRFVQLIFGSGMLSNIPPRFWEIGVAAAPAPFRNQGTDRQSIRLLLVLLFAAGSFFSCRAQPPGKGWQLTFEDHFNGTELDTTKWSVGYGWGDRTGWTREIIDPKYVQLKEGRLLLLAEPTGEGDYWAGAVNTKNKFSQEYGYFEARLKAAKGQGVLSCWWGKRNTEEWPPEIDIAEIFGAVNPTGDSTLGPWKTSMNIHYKPAGEKRLEDQTFFQLPEGKLFTQDFHTLAVLWGPTELIWYLDGQEVKRTSKGVAYLNQPFYWMLNLHICSKEIEWPGCPNENNVWPVAMEVEHVKAWKKVETPAKEKKSKRTSSHQ